MTRRAIPAAIVLALVLALWIFLAEHALAGHSHRYLVAKRTVAGLRYYDRARPIPMIRTGWILEQAGHRYNVNPALIAGIAAKETQLGRTSCLSFEAWGLGACGHAWTPPTFQSWRESTFYFARHLRVRFLNRGARSVSAILAGGYCASACGAWTADVLRFMRPFRLGSGVTYP